MKFKYQKVEVDTDQRIYVFGDLHGRFDLVKEIFTELGIKKEEIKVFLSDSIDRGDENLKCLELIQPHNPNTYAVMGNHEDLALQGLLGNRDYFHCWLGNGGQDTVDEIGWDEIDSIIPMISHLPHALEVVRGDKSYGFTHAGFPPFLSAYPFKELQSPHMQHQYGDNLAHSLMWDRTSAKATEDGMLLNNVKGVEYIFHGHSVMRRHAINGNRVFLDTGSFCYNNITCAVIEPDGEIWFYSNKEGVMDE